MGTDIDPVLTRVVQHAARRLTARHAVRTGSHAAVWVVAALVAVTAAGVVVPISAVSPRMATAAAATAAMVAAGIVMLTRRTDIVHAACILDLAVHLDERASTAVELTRVPQAPSALGARVIADAAARLRSVDLRQAMPIQLPRQVWSVPALIAVLAVWPVLVSGVALPGTPAHRAQQAIRREGARLEQFAQQLQARARVERLPLTRRTVPQLRDLGVRLQQDRVDRAGALARITQLSRQLDIARRQIDQRLAESSKPRTSPTLPSEALQRDALQRQIRQVQELTSRLRESGEAVSKDLLDRLGAITNEGEGTQPAPVRQQLQRAQQQLESGDAAGAGESLTKALRMLEGIDVLQADREGLESVRQELERSQAAIMSGVPGPRTDEQAESSQDQAPQRVGPGPRQVDARAGGDSPPPPEGPREGSAPGTGRVAEKLGLPTSRLQADRTPQRVRGAQSTGEVSTSEVIGAGRPGTARVPPQAVSVALLARLDRALERAHIPAQYRWIVQTYFQRLAQLK